MRGFLAFIPMALLRDTPRAVVGRTQAEEFDSQKTINFMSSEDVLDYK